MLLPALVVASLLCCTHAESTRYSSDVRALIDKYRELSAPADILDSLERLGEDSRELVKLAHPIGSLLINATLEVDIDEAIAMIDLHHFLQVVKADANNTSQEDYGIHQKIRDIYNEMVALTSAHRNSTDKESTIQKLNRILHDIFINPSYLNDPYFNIGFYNIHDPNTIANKMDFEALVNCRTPTEEEMEKFRRVQEAFKRLATRLSVPLQQELSRGWDFGMNDFLDIAMRAPTSYVNWMIAEIDKIGSPSVSHELYLHLYNIVWKKLENEETKKMSGWTYTCTSRERNAKFVNDYDYQELENSVTSTTFEFNTTILLEELRKTRSDLLRLVLAKSISMAMEPNEEAFVKEADEIKITLRQAGIHISGFARKIQDLSWPKIGIDSAKEAIGSEQIAIDSYNETAQAIRSALKAQGSKSFAYQVLVVPTSRVDIDWSVASVKSDLPHMSSYTNIIDLYGVNIHIFRFNQTEAVQRSSNAQKLFNRHSEYKMGKLRANGSKDDAATLLTKLNVHSPVFGKDLLRSVFLMKSVQVSVSTKLNTIEFEPVPFGLASSGTEPFVLDTQDTLSWKLFYFL